MGNDKKRRPRDIVKNKTIEKSPKFQITNDSELTQFTLRRRRMDELNMQF